VYRRPCSSFRPSDRRLLHRLFFFCVPSFPLIFFRFLGSRLNSCFLQTDTLAVPFFSFFPPPPCICLLILTPASFSKRSSSHVFSRRMQFKRIPNLSSRSLPFPLLFLPPLRRFLSLIAAPAPFTPGQASISYPNQYAQRRTVDSWSPPTSPFPIPLGRRFTPPPPHSLTHLSFDADPLVFPPSHSFFVLLTCRCHFPFPTKPVSLLPLKQV